MGLGSLKDAPDSPTAMQTVGAQTGTNIGTSIANAKFGYVGTKTPYGQTKLKKVGKTKYTDPYTGQTYKIPKFEERVKLTPEGKEQFKLQQGTQTNLLKLGNQLSGQMGQYLSTPFKLGDFDFGADLGVGAYQPGESLDGQVWNGDPLKLGNEATEARLMELGSKRLDPKFAREQETLQSSLMARGIREGTAAWNAAMGQFGETKNDAYNQLLLEGRGQAAAEGMAEWESGLRGQGQTFNQLVQSRGLGMAEQGQQFTQSLADRQRILAERQQETGEAFAQRSQPINEIAALLGTGGQVNIPQLTGYSTTQIPITDTAGLMNKAWEQQFQAWQAESQATQGLMGGLFGMAGNIFASDERIKDKGEQVGTTPEGLPIYEFRIGDGAIQTGVMAQDVEEVNPEAVIETPEGVKAVDYGQVATDGAYTVQKGDNLWNIGKRFNVPVEGIIAANPQIANPDRIMPGDQIAVPGLAAPGPEAIPYDPLSSAFLPPEGGGVDAVADALTPEQVDALTMVDDAGNYMATGEPVPMTPLSDFPARPEAPALPMPGMGGMSAEVGGAPPPPAPPMQDSGALAFDEMFRRRQMENMMGGAMPQAAPPPGAPPASRATDVLSGADRTGAMGVQGLPQVDVSDGRERLAQMRALPGNMNATGGGPWGESYETNPSLFTDLGFYDERPERGRMPPELALDAMPSGPPADTRWSRAPIPGGQPPSEMPFNPPTPRFDLFGNYQPASYTDAGGAFEYQPPPERPSTVVRTGEGAPNPQPPSTTGTWDDLPDPTPQQMPTADELVSMFGDAFDTPAGQAEIMDLLTAFQRRNMPPMIPGGMMPMRAGIGGF